jgi:hypothetical protein
MNLDIRKRALKDADKRNAARKDRVVVRLVPDDKLDPGPAVGGA